MIKKTINNKHWYIIQLKQYKNFSLNKNKLNKILKINKSQLNSSDKQMSMMNMRKKKKSQYWKLINNLFKEYKKTKKVGFIMP